MTFEEQLAQLPESDRAAVERFQAFLRARRRLRAWLAEDPETRLAYLGITPAWAREQGVDLAAVVRGLEAPEKEMP